MSPMAARFPVDLIQTKGAEKQICPTYRNRATCRLYQFPPPGVVPGGDGTCFITDGAGTECDVLPRAQGIVSASCTKNNVHDALHFDEPLRIQFVGLFGASRSAGQSRSAPAGGVTRRFALRLPRRHRLRFRGTARCFRFSYGPTDTSHNAPPVNSLKVKGPLVVIWC